MLANCLHDLTALGSGALASVALAMLLAGLAGGVTHCAGMCAPFVLAQAGAASGRGGGGFLSRMSGAALVPYHAGRMIGYAALGGLAGATAGAVSQVTGLRQLLAALLLLAAVMMARQAVGRLPLSWRRRLLPRGGPSAAVAGSYPDLLLRPIGRLMAAPGGWNGFGLGLLLSGLPCGLLYAALAAAAATGSALAGALAMLAFTLGTIPALLGVGLFGRFFLRRAGPLTQMVGGVLFLLNAALLATMAVQLAA
ncbi:urease accessory protein UreH domain-containing protein [Falsiroseomonas tokyonensis]|uniref:Sulfite exporter TauE/SafE family protein n=1 Tax=Falsiroseomonas tokyonensis TaxID=430521 RepID=A0ABV7BS18_9PROT|nr:sulfite exporter TauE/SafE family protein [Falsiroseomonas tokyonensis]MBU8538340.1 sulfite exporter TauE/SafE family protein [Falsiroseomonas tokyonensis]